MATIVKSSRHSTKFANIGKQSILQDFLREYHRVIWLLVDYLWETRIEWGDEHVFDIKHQQLDIPMFISTTDIGIETRLSARALKTATGEAIGIVKSRTAKRRKYQYKMKALMRSGDLADAQRMQSKIDSTPLTKPSKSRTLTANLNSICCEFIEVKSAEFDGFLKLKSLGKQYGTIYVPIKNTRHSKQLQSRGYHLMSSWQISLDEVCSRWEMEKPTNDVTKTKIVGIDQGYKTCVTLSDGQVTGHCLHGHDLESIIGTISRKKRGSKGFARAAAHRTNYINWSIKQLNLADVKEVHLEKLRHVRRGRNIGTKLGHWTYTQINEQISSICEELGVPVIEQDSRYRSQRCNDCGWTQKSNRKGKEFCCRRCGVIRDADLNGALNHEVDIYPLPFGIWHMKMNRVGFYWTDDGIYDSYGQEITVPDEKQNHNHNVYNVHNVHK